MTQRRQLIRKLERPEQIRPTLGWIQQNVAKALQAGTVQIILCRPSKSREQEAKYHAMIGDIRYQCFRGHSEEAIKAVLVNQFALEMAEQGEPLSHPGQTAWDWRNQAPVYVRPSTKKFRKHEAAAFIEFLYATGSELRVQWSEKALAVYDQHLQERSA